MSVHVDRPEDMALLNLVGRELFRLVVKARSLAAAGRKLCPPDRTGRTREGTAERRVRI